MESTKDITGSRRPFNWRFSLATAFTVALHAVAFMLMLAPVLAPHASERPRDRNVEINLIEPPPTPPKPPPPAPEPPQRPHPQIVHRDLQPVQIPTPPVAIDEPSPMAQTALPLTPPAPQQASSNVGPSAMVSYRDKYPPKYPIQAIRQQQEGIVKLKILVGTDGSPLKIELSDSSGHRSLDRAAIAAARQWKFNPATENGVPRQGWVIIPVAFNLNRY